jgi:hypothetical protein
MRLWAAWLADVAAAAAGSAAPEVLAGGGSTIGPAVIA